MPYDEETGLVYDEGSIYVPKNNQYLSYLDKLYHENRRVRSEQKDCVSSNGTATLRATACRCLLKHSQNLNSEMIKPFPTLVVREIYDTFQKSGQDNLAVWQLFAETGHFDNSFERTEQHDGVQPSQMPDLVQSMNSSTIMWMVDVNITQDTSLFPLIHLWKLQNIRSIIIRNIAKQPVAFSWNKLIREWLLATQDDGAFKHLGSMSLDLGVDELASRYIQGSSKFPALEKMFIRGRVSPASDRPLLGGPHPCWTVRMFHDESDIKADKADGLCRTDRSARVFALFAPRISEVAGGFCAEDSLPRLKLSSVTTSTQHQSAGRKNTQDDYPTMLYTRDRSVPADSFSEPIAEVIPTTPAPKKRKIKTSRALDLRAVLNGA